MKRLLVFALAMSLGQSSVAFAGETLLESAKRVTRQVTESPVPTAHEEGRRRRSRSFNPTPARGR